jgi:hypothetical protein
MSGGNIRSAWEICPLLGATTALTALFINFKSISARTAYLQNHNYQRSAFSFQPQRGIATLLAFPVVAGYLGAHSLFPLNAILLWPLPAPGRAF